MPITRVIDIADFERFARDELAKDLKTTVGEIPLRIGSVIDEWYNKTFQPTLKSMVPVKSGRLLKSLQFKLDPNSVFSTIRGQSYFSGLKPTVTVTTDRPDAWPRSEGYKDNVIKAKNVEHLTIPSPNYLNMWGEKRTSARNVPFKTFLMPDKFNKDDFLLLKKLEGNKGEIIFYYKKEMKAPAPTHWIKRGVDLTVGKLILELTTKGIMTRE